MTTSKQSDLKQWWQDFKDEWNKPSPPPPPAPPQCIRCGKRLEPEAKECVDVESCRMFLFRSVVEELRCMRKELTTLDKIKSELYDIRRELEKTIRPL